MAQWDWRKEKATKKQLDLIIQMHEHSEFPLSPFKGTTKGEAYDYIQENLNKSCECMDLYEMSRY